MSRRLLLLLLLALPCLAQEPPLQVADGAWTLAILPDTQYYSASYPQHFAKQTQWLADHAKELNLTYVLHMGDLTDHNNDQEWTVAQQALKTLDGVAPVALVPGNHDYGDNGKSNKRETLLSKYFSPTAFAKAPTFGGLLDPNSLENSYHLFRAGGRDWLILCLEYGPRNETVTWAQGVLDKYPARRAIVITHAYMNLGNQRQNAGAFPRQIGNPHTYDFDKLPGGVNDGEELWTKLIQPRPNVVFVFSGHVPGVSRLTSVNAAGKDVHQVLTDFQAENEGGQGYLRLVTLAPDGKEARVRTYSPVLNKWRTGALHEFALDLTTTAY